MILVNTVIDII